MTVAAQLSRLAGGFSGCSFLGLTWINERIEGSGSKLSYSATCNVLIYSCLSARWIDRWSLAKRQTGSAVVITNR